MDLVISQKRKSWLPVLLVLAGGTLLWKYWPQVISKGRFFKANQRLKKFFKEEKNNNIPFPKEVDLEPAFT